MALRLLRIVEQLLLRSSRRHALPAAHQLAAGVAGSAHLPDGRLLIRQRTTDIERTRSGCQTLTLLTACRLTRSRRSGASSTGCTTRCSTAWAIATPAT